MEVRREVIAWLRLKRYDEAAFLVCFGEISVTAAFAVQSDG